MIIKLPRVVIIHLFLLFIFNVYAQEHHGSEEKRVKDPGFEIVTSGLWMYTAEEGTLDFATELHLTYWISHTWAFGIGYTLIYEEENSVVNEIAALASHKPWHFLTLNFGPSVSIPNSESELEVSAYTEAEFNFEIGEIHTGPLIGTLIGEEFRFFFGVHLSYDF